jgi:hypothetical protein
MWWLALAHDSGYERVATPGCSGRTIRRRLAEWSELGAAETLGGGATALVDERLRQDPPDDRPVRPTPASPVPAGPRIEEPPTRTPHDLGKTTRKERTLKARRERTG